MLPKGCLDSLKILKGEALPHPNMAIPPVQSVDEVRAEPNRVHPINVDCLPVEVIVISSSSSDASAPWPFSPHHGAEDSGDEISLNSFDEYEDQRVEDDDSNQFQLPCTGSLMWIPICTPWHPVILTSYTAWAKFVLSILEICQSPPLKFLDYFLVLF